LLDRLENGETLDQETQQQAYLCRQGERKALGKSLEEGCDHQTAHDADVERMVAAGMGRDFANLMNDAWEAFSKGLLREKEPTATSRMQSAIENFIREQLTPAIVAPARLRSPAATSKMEPVH